MKKRFKPKQFNAYVKDLDGNGVIPNLDKEVGEIEMEWPASLTSGLQFSMVSKGYSSANEALGDLEEAHQEAVQGVAQELSQYLDALFEAGWAWSSGARDIIDTGELKRSQKIEVSGDEISVNYSSPYVNLVHYGGYIYPYGNELAEKVYLPARPFLDVAFGQASGPLPAFDFDEAYNRYLSM